MNKEELEEARVNISKEMCGFNSEQAEEILIVKRLHEDDVKLHTDSSGATGFAIELKNINDKELASVIASVLFNASQSHCQTMKEQLPSNLLTKMQELSTVTGRSNDRAMIEASVAMMIGMVSDRLNEQLSQHKE